MKGVFSLGNNSVGTWLSRGTWFRGQIPNLFHCVLQDVHWALRNLSPLCLSQSRGLCFFHTASSGFPSASFPHGLCNKFLCFFFFFPWHGLFPFSFFGHPLFSLCNLPGLFSCLQEPRTLLDPLTKPWFPSLQLLIARTGGRPRRTCTAASEQSLFRCSRILLSLWGWKRHANMYSLAFSFIY